MPEFSEYDCRVSKKAYNLWEEAGRPEGKADYFWREAERELKSRWDYGVNVLTFFVEPSDDAS